MKRQESEKEWKKRGRNKRKGAGKTKKKSLFSFWLGVWVPVFIIVMLAIGAGTGYAYSSVEDELSGGFESWIEDVFIATDWDQAVGSVNAYEIRDAKEREQYVLRAKVNQLWNYGIYGVIYDEKGEMLDTTRATVYFGYRANEDDKKTGSEEMRWYQCGSEKTANEIISILNSYSKDEYTSYKFDDVYIKDGLFYPSKMVFFKDDEQIKTFSLFSGNEDLSLSTHLGNLLEENEDSDYDQLISVYGQNDDNGDFLDLYWDEEYLKYLTEIENPEESSLYSYIYHGFNEQEAQSYQKVTVGDHDYYVLFGKMIHPFTVIKNDVFAALIIGTVFTILFALAIAANFYRIYKKEVMLQERQKEFSNALAHDLKTPMMAISGYTENLAEQTHPEKQEHYIRGIQSNISYMNELVGQILELAKVDHEIELKKENVNLRDLVEKIVTMHEKMAEEKQIEVQVIGEATIYADAGYMERVIANLLKNALEFSPEHQSVLIKLSQTNVEITNTGVEIPAEQLEEMWKPFVKGDKIRSRESGHGLGLAIVKEILDMHGFDYEMTSEHEAVTVRIHLGLREH